MKTLDELAIEFGTDKATSHPVGAHGYAPEYDRIFRAMRKEPLKMLEIGVGGGESIRMWLEYFPRALVHGVDIVSDTNPYNTVGSKEIERYVFTKGDQSHDVFWKCFLADFGSQWDIIIDDGGHFSNQIITSFDSLWPALNSGGYYAIEDLAVSLDPSTIFVPAGSMNHMAWIRQKMEDLNRGDNSYRIDYSRELAVFHKR